MQELYQELRNKRKLALNVEELSQESQIYLPLKLSTIQQDYLKQDGSEIFIEIEEILSKTMQTIILGQSGCGKTVLARKIDEQIIKISEQAQVVTIFISAENDVGFSFNTILQQQLLFLNEEQIDRFENDVLQDKLKVFIIIDDFDQFLLKNEQFLVDLRNSFLKSKGRIIYFINKQVTDNDKYQKWIEIESEIEKYEITKLNKNDVQKYFENYFHSEKYISTKDFSEAKNKKILKSIVKRLKKINNICDILIKIIKLSSIVDNFELEAANAMTILKELKSIFRNQDFSNIRLKNSCFDDVSFHQCNFEGSQMNNVDISRCWFISCNLDNVVWQNMRKYEVQFYVGNQESVKSLTFTNDSKIVAFNSQDSRIEFWHTKASKRICEFQVGYVLPGSLVFSSNNYLFAYCSQYGRIKIQSCSSRKTIRSIEKVQKGTCFTLVFSFDDKILAYVSDKIIFLWNTKVSKLSQEIAVHIKYIQQVAFSPNNKFLSSSSDRTVQIWNMVKRKQQLVLKRNDEIVISMQFSPDSKYLATGRVDGYVQLWDILSGKLEAEFVCHNDSISALKFSINGKYLASGGREGTVVLWALEQENDEEERSQVEEDVTKEEESEEDCTLNSLSESESEDQSSIQNNLIKHWNLSEKNFEEWQKDGNLIHSLQFLHQENTLISGNKQGTIKIHDLRDNRKLKFDLNLSNCVTFSPSGKLFATCDNDRKIQFWDLKQGKFQKIFAEQSDGAVEQIAFSFDETLLASCSHHNIHIWCVKTGNHICEFNGHRRELTCIAFSPTELILASGSEDQSIIIWDVKKQKQIKKLNDQDSVISQLAYSHCGKLLVSCGGYKIYLWDPNLGKLLKTFKHDQEVQTIALPIDGQILAAGYSDQTIVFWDVKSGDQISSIQGISVSYCLKFSPNGKLLASGNENSTISIWNIEDPQSFFILKGPRESVMSIDFSPDGQILSSSSKDESIYFWHIEQKIQTCLSHEQYQNQQKQECKAKITPLYSFSRDFALKANDSSLRNSIIVSEKGVNLTQLFLQTGGHK